MKKRWQVKHISDDQVRHACAESRRRSGVATGEVLMDMTGAPMKVVLRKLEQCCDRRLVESGVSVWCCWWIGPEPSDSAQDNSMEVTYD